MLIGGDFKEGDIRLVGGSYSWGGRVEIYLGGKWGTITDDRAGYTEAHVVCRQLGYSTQCKPFFPIMTLMRFTHNTFLYKYKNHFMK